MKPDILSTPVSLDTLYNWSSENLGARESRGLERADSTTSCWPGSPNMANKSTNNRTLCLKYMVWGCDGRGQLVFTQSRVELLVNNEE